MKKIIEAGLKEHWYFIRGLKNQMKGSLYMKSLNWKFDVNINSNVFQALTLSETFKAVFLLIDVGFILSLVIYIFEILCYFF